jgi:uncharacterized protein with PIN domain
MCKAEGSSPFSNQQSTIENKAVHSATFHFHASLNDFLPREQKNVPITRDFQLRASVKDTIEAIGIPHTEIEAIFANDASVSFAYIVAPDDEIHVYPAFASPPDSTPMRPPLTELRFVLDTHLGRLATYLRMLGFDTLWRAGYDDAELARVSSSENRILLTRDRGVLKRGEVVYGYYVRATGPREQLREIVRRYHLAGSIEAFTRCLRCNVRLAAVEKHAIADRLQPMTAQHYDEFRRCPSCDRVYWPGSHYEHMQHLIESIRQDV